MLSVPIFIPVDSTTVRSVRMPIPPGNGYSIVSDSTADEGYSWQLSSGGVSDHDDLGNLPWSTAGHTGTASRVAGFDGAGSATYYVIGTGSGQLAAGDHNHSGVYVPVGGTWSGAALTGTASRIAGFDGSGNATTYAFGTTAGTVSAGDHNHSGVYVPVGGSWSGAALTGTASRVAGFDGSGNATTYVIGTSAGNVAAGDHNHSGVYQPLDATLTGFSAVTIAADKLPYGNGTDSFATVDFGAAHRALLNTAIYADAGYIPYFSSTTTADVFLSSTEGRGQVYTVTIRPTADKSVTSSTTLVDVTGGAESLLPGEYEVEGVIWFGASATGDMKFRLLASGGGIDSDSKYGVGVSVSPSNTKNAARFDTSGDFCDAGGQNTAAPFNFVNIRGWIKVTSTTTVTLSFAQATSTATASVLYYKGTYIKFTYIGGT